MMDIIMSQWSVFQAELPQLASNLQFLRGGWFYAFIPFFIFLFLAYKTRLNKKNWASVIDPALIPFVLTSTATKKRRYPLLLTLIAGSLCITALAGPVYKKLPQPVYREQSSLVVLLDLSQSMNATDIKPSRLARARLKLLDLLKTRKTGQTALVVYAADAFVVTPLTDDNATIANLIPSLETTMMPAQGSNLSSALAKTSDLFTQAGIINGDILVITDGIKSSDAEAIEKVGALGHRLSILGVGSENGAPVPLTGEGQSGFLLDKHGAIVIPKLDTQSLRRFALSGRGIYAHLHADDSDIDKLNALLTNKALNNSDAIKDLNADQWQEEGQWLLLPLVFIAAFWARKGWIASLTFALYFSLSVVPSPAYADSNDNKLILDNLWFSNDQQGMKSFNNGDSAKAAEKFNSKEWKASAHYRNGNYEAASKALEGIETADAHYNRANALARQGKYQEAIAAYDKALELDKSNDDASYNREQVQKVLEKSQQNSDQQQDGDPSDESSEDSSDKQQDGDSSDSSSQNSSDKQQGSQSDKKDDSASEDNADSKENENGEEKSNEQTGKDAQQSDTQPSDEQQSEKKSGSKSASDKQQDEELKQRDASTETEQQKKEQQNYQKQQNAPQEQDGDSEDQQEPSDEIENMESNEKPAEIEINPEEASITEEEKTTEQWLRRIPDDPGGLLRRKFYYQYKHVPNQSDSDEPW